MYVSFQRKAGPSLRGPKTRKEFSFLSLLLKKNHLFFNYSEIFLFSKRLFLSHILSSDSDLLQLQNTFFFLKEKRKDRGVPQVNPWL